MNQIQQFPKAEIQKYTLAGVGFGLLFPVVGTLIKIADSNLPYEFMSVVTVQASEPLLWILDAVPVLLGFFAFIASHRQGNLQKLNQELQQQESELEEIKANLQKNVEERTRDLIVANQQITERAERLKLIAEVARSAITVQDMSRLLPHITHLISQRFNFYHVGIFLLDEEKEYAVLRASNSPGGLRMIKKGHRLKIGAQGIVGYVSQTGKVRIALNVEDDPAYFGGEDLPDTRSEIALPLKSGEIILGVLDIQSKEANAFSEDDSATLSILADQVAIAIQSAISHEQSQRALLEAETTSRQTANQAWKVYRQILEKRGYRYDGVRSEPFKEGSESFVSNNTLNLPVRLRGQTIGHLRLNHRESTHVWTEDELSMAEATAERVALALEGARLLEDAQKRAARETFLSEISAKLSTSFQMDSILRDTVEELGQTLKQSAITFQLVNPSESTGMDGPRHNGNSAAEENSE
ncbi:MAG TPA: GAF domain-containing protein [Anaerolineales bacterium]|nr:GAF domain-containing protein [Anaerolineales bacterium]